MNERIKQLAERAGLTFSRPFGWWVADDADLEHFAELVRQDEREKVATWMMQHGYATGHGDTTEDLLIELDWQIVENWNRAAINGIETEREACAKLCSDWGEAVGNHLAATIRARGNT